MRDHQARVRVSDGDWGFRVSLASRSIAEALAPSRRARGVRVPPAARSEGRRRRGRGARRAPGIARAAGRARDHRRASRAAGSGAEATRTPVVVGAVERMGSRGAHSAFQRRTLSHVPFADLRGCRDFSDYRVTRGTAPQALVMKGRRFESRRRLVAKSAPAASPDFATPAARSEWGPGRSPATDAIRVL